jgi:hypothetical protein
MNKKRGGSEILNKDVPAHLCKLMFVIEPGAYIGEREKEPSTWTKRIVMSFSLERRTDQIGRDDVQMEVSFHDKKK